MACFISLQWLSGVQDLRLSRSSLEFPFIESIPANSPTIFRNVSTVCRFLVFFQRTAILERSPQDTLGVFCGSFVNLEIEIRVPPGHTRADLCEVGHHFIVELLMLRTHFSRKGALAMARPVTLALPEAEPRLKQFLRD